MYQMGYPKLFTLSTKYRFLQKKKVLSFEIMKRKYVGLYLKGMSGKGKHLQF